VGWSGVVAPSDSALAGAAAVGCHCGRGVRIRRLHRATNASIGLLIPGSPAIAQRRCPERDAMLLRAIRGGSACQAVGGLV